LAVGKQAAQQFHVEKFNVRKLSELEVKKQYQIKISNRFAALENLNESEDMKGVWENIKEHIKTSANYSLGLYELRQHKPWFDVKCLGFFDQRKHAKQDFSYRNGCAKEISKEIKVRKNKKWTYKGYNGSEREAGHYRHHREEKAPVVWPR
jgi:hypothetical protein